MLFTWLFFGHFYRALNAKIHCKYMSKAVVTKGNRITLARNVRERLGIREGDKLVLNVAGSVLMISKKNAKILMNSILFVMLHLTKNH